MCWTRGKSLNSIYIVYYFRSYFLPWTRTCQPTFIAGNDLEGQLSNNRTTVSSISTSLSFYEWFMAWSDICGEITTGFHFKISPLTHVGPLWPHSLLCFYIQIIEKKLMKRKSRTGERGGRRKRWDCSLKAAIRTQQMNEWARVATWTLVCARTHAHVGVYWCEHARRQARSISLGRPVLFLDEIFIQRFLSFLFVPHFSFLMAPLFLYLAVNNIYSLNYFSEYSHLLLILLSWRMKVCIGKLLSGMENRIGWIC